MIGRLSRLGSSAISLNASSRESVLAERPIVLYGTLFSLMKSRGSRSLKISLSSLIEKGCLA